MSENLAPAERSVLSWPMAAICLVAALTTLSSPAVAGAVVLSIALFSLASHSLVAALCVLLVVAPWGSLGNVVTGGRFFALGIDVTFGTLAVFSLFAPDIRRQERSIEGTALVVILGLFLFGLFALFNPRGLGISDALEGFRAFYFPLLAFPLGYTLARQTRQFPPLLTRALILSTAVVAVMGIRQVFLPLPLDLAIINNSQTGIVPFQVTATGRLRAFSPMPGPFHLGFLLVLGILLCSAVTLRKWRLSVAILTVLMAFALVLNATRLNWLAAAVGLPVLWATTLNRQNVLRLLGAGVVAAFAFLVAVWVVWSVPAFSPLRTFATELLLNPTGNTSYVYRVLGWQYEVLPAITASPWLGWGTGAAKDGIGLFRSHNILLKVLLEGGLVAFAAYVALGATIAIILLRRRTNDLARVGLALLVAVHAGGMFGPLLDAYPVNMFYWLILGAACGQPLEAVPEESTAVASK